MNFEREFELLSKISELERELEKAKQNERMADERFCSL